jgi:tetratricopeptide (TPR) repeat protein
MNTPVLAVLLLVLSFVGGGEARGAFAPQSAAESHYREGLKLRWQEDYDAALMEFSEAIAIAPDYVGAHREYQNIMLSFGLQEDLVRYYEGRVKRNPRSALAHYLYGRVLDDPHQQIGEFRKAVLLDGRFFWGHYGMAIVSLRMGRKRVAEREIESALSINPLSSHGRLASAIVDSLSGRHECALDTLKGLLREDTYNREAYHAALCECRILDLFDEGAELSGNAVRYYPEDALLLAYNGYFLARVGDKRNAIRFYEKARAREPLTFLYIKDLRQLYAEEGMHKKVVGLWRDSFGSVMTMQGNELLPAWRKLEEAVGVGGGPEEAREIARAYMDLGWWTEAASMRPKLEAGGAFDPEMVALLGEADRKSALLSALTRYEREFYIEQARDEGKVSFNGAMVKLERTAREASGSPLILPGAVRSSLGLKWLGDTPEEQQPLLDIVRTGNKQLIFFDNVFGKDICFVLGADLFRTREKGAEGAFSYRRAICCRYDSIEGMEESGLAYPPFTGYAVFYDKTRWNDLCELQKQQKRNPLAHGWFIEQVEGKSIGVREVLYSRMLERRLFEKVSLKALPGERASFPEYIEGLYDSIVAAHEYQHLVDLRGHLPVWKHPFKCFLLGGRSIFIPRLIEASFEERAVLHSLAYGKDALLGLLTVQSQLSQGEGAHTIAARRVLQRLVDYVAENPGDFQAIDFRRNILNQIYLLEGRDIHRIARLLSEGE